MINKIKELIIKKKEKKKKGFTLVELLAVIVILAIVMIIAIPTVLGSMTNSKQKSFETVGQSMKKYIEDNYHNCKLGNKDIAKYDETIFYPDCSLKDNISESLIKNSGYSTEDIINVDVVMSEDGEFALKIDSNINGKFANIDSYKTSNYVEKNYSSSCWTTEEITDGEYAGTYKLTEFHGINNDESNSDYGKVDSNCSGYVSQDKDGYYSINIPSKIENKVITTLGNDLFCALDDFYFDVDTKTEYIDMNNYQFIKSINISNGIKKIEDGNVYADFGTFYYVGYNGNNYILDNVNIKLPSSLTYIGDNSFRYVPINGELILPKSIASIGELSFENSLIIKIIFEGASDKTSKLKYIKWGAFAHNKLSYLDETNALLLPNDVETISSCAFCDNYDLNYIKFTGDSSKFEENWDDSFGDGSSSEKIIIITE